MHWRAARHHRPRRCGRRIRRGERQDEHRGRLPGGGGHWKGALFEHRDRFIWPATRKPTCPSASTSSYAIIGSRADAPPPHQSQTVSRSGFNDLRQLRQQRLPLGRPRRLPAAKALIRKAPHEYRAWDLVPTLRQDAKASCTCREKAHQLRFPFLRALLRNQTPFNIERFDTTNVLRSPWLRLLLPHLAQSERECAGGSDVTYRHLDKCR